MFIALKKRSKACGGKSAHAIIVKSVACPEELTNELNELTEYEESNALL